MRAYAFLAPEGIDYLTGLRWPVPDDLGPGAWLETDGAPPLRGCTADQLIWWLDRKLWEVELAGDVRERARSLTAERGRLLAPVDAWTPDVARELIEECALRVRDRAVVALGADGRDADAASLAAAADLDAIADAAAGSGDGDGAGSLLAAYAADLVRFSSFQPDAARAAAVAARIAAQALAGGDERREGYDEAYAEERRRQAGWLRTRLGL